MNLHKPGLDLSRIELKPIHQDSFRELLKSFEGVDVITLGDPVLNREFKQVSNFNFYTVLPVAITSTVAFSSYKALLNYLINVKDEGFVLQQFRSFAKYSVQGYNYNHKLRLKGEDLSSDSIDDIASDVPLTAFLGKSASVDVYLVNSSRSKVFSRSVVRPERIGLSFRTFSYEDLGFLKNAGLDRALVLSKVVAGCAYLDYFSWYKRKPHFSKDFVRNVIRGVISPKVKIKAYSEKGAIGKLLITP